MNRMDSNIVRNLTLAHAAIKHALYFLEIDADVQAASYCSYAAHHLQSFATGLIDESSASTQDYHADIVLNATHALACQ